MRGLKNACLALRLEQCSPSGLGNIRRAPNLLTFTKKDAWLGVGLSVFISFASWSNMVFHDCSAFSACRATSPSPCSSMTDVSIACMPKVSDAWAGGVQSKSCWSFQFSPSSFFRGILMVTKKVEAMLLLRRLPSWMNHIRWRFRIMMCVLHSIANMMEWRLYRRFNDVWQVTHYWTVFIF